MKKVKIAVTGGIGSGKSTAISYIRDLGFPVFSCDQIYGEIIQTDEFIQKIANVFPETIINGKIERGILGEIVFSNPKKREELNAIAHPLIMRVLFQRMDTCEYEYVFAEVPLLFEGNFENQFDKIIVISQSETKRIEYVQKRNNLSEEEIKNRINAQFKYDSLEGLARLKKCKAFVIQNTSTKEELFIRIQEVIDKIKKQS